MEGAEIGLVLAQAADLRLKISECIRRTGGERSAKSERYEEERDEEEEEKEKEEEGDGEQEAFLAICDALKSLEDQLAQLQVFLVFLLCYLSNFLDLRISFDFDGEQLFSYINCSEAFFDDNFALLTMPDGLNLT
jgi:hypothetical protein